MIVQILDEARREFLDAVTYYDAKEVGLGRRFRSEVAAVVDWIQMNHEVPRVRPHGYRRVNLRAFPHFVAYVIRKDVIWITAIAHAYRRPEHWIGRMKTL
jgi:hypothetical protein